MCDLGTDVAQSDDAYRLACQFVERPAEIGEDGTGGLCAGLYGIVEVWTVAG